MSGSTLRSRTGVAFRTIRRSLGATQQQVADAAGLSKSLVCDLELGHVGVSLDSVDRVAIAMGCRPEIVLRGPVLLGRPGGERSTGDLAHARIVGATRRILVRAGFECLVEQEIAAGNTRGWIDLIAYDPTHRRLIVIECKTQLRDLGGLDRQVETYARSCLQVAAAHGWQPIEIVVVVVVLATAENDAVILANRDLLGSRYPMRGRAGVAALLDNGPIGGRGVLLIDPARRGRAAFLTSRADGRRTEAPYRDYADFMRRCS
jgi:transcriptional regulator with XRE-family HTH domain